jgi:tRNA nucleotidyltransferase (CCA-adding enzyme)
MPDLLTQLQPVLAAIVAAGGLPLIVGGAVRDRLLGHEPKDIDVEVYRLDVAQLTEVLARLGRIDAVGRSFGILKLRLPGGYEFDVSLPRRESKVGAGHRGFIAEPDPLMTPREAAARRDFTFNALALTPSGELLDFFGGQADLAAGILRHTTAAFAEDPLRVLRAMQFAARFDMRLAPETADLCRALLPEAATLSIERIWGEWYKWAVQGRKPSAGLRVLHESGWIARYPAIAALIDCPQDPLWHPEGSVYQHTLFVCDAAAQLAEREALADHQRVVLLFAALCHDLGKPSTTVFVDGHTRSPGHAEAGVALARSLLGQLGSPDNVSAPVLPLVREHLVHIGMTPTERAVRRLALRLAPATIEQWGHLVEADHSGRPPLPPGAPGEEIVAVARRIGTSTGRPAPILLGRHLLEAGWQPGPALGQALRRAYQAQIDGAFTTVGEGLIWVARNM